MTGRTYSLVYIGAGLQLFRGIDIAESESYVGYRLDAFGDCFIALTFRARTYAGGIADVLYEQYDRNDRYKKPGQHRSNQLLWSTDYRL
jgi:hypothetical protein